MRIGGIERNPSRRGGHEPDLGIGRTASTLAGLLMLLAAVPASALPRYTVRYGQNCTLCHVSPTGGGMRSLYASQYLVPQELAARSTPPTGGEGLLEGFTPELSPNVTVGVDARTLLHQEEGGSGTILSMQGDVYLHLQTGATTSVYLEHGQNGGGEAYGMVTALPADGYARFGRFVPDFGWRFDDHTLATRRYLTGPAGADGVAALLFSGVEAGISPGPLFLSASALNGGTSLGDSYAARGMLLQGVGGWNLGAGASVLRRSTGVDDWRASGFFWALNWGAVTWLGEYDETRSAGRVGNLAGHEVTVLLGPGLEARLTYGFQDPDRSLASGARHRYGAGLAYVPRPGLSLLVMANRTDVDEGPGLAGSDLTGADVVIHFFY